MDIISFFNFFDICTFRQSKIAISNRDSNFSYYVLYNIKNKTMTFTNKAESILFGSDGIAEESSKHVITLFTRYNLEIEYLE